MHACPVQLLYLIQLYQDFYRQQSENFWYENQVLTDQLQTNAICVHIPRDNSVVPDSLVKDKKSSSNPNLVHIVESTGN